MCVHITQFSMSELLSIIQENKPTPPASTSRLGLRGESEAADFLVRNGYRLVVANFKAPVGRNSRGVQITGEIDLIALDGETLCFVEVKTRRSEAFTPIITNVDRRKQRQIIRTARVYRRIFRIREIELRYDVVAVLMPKYSNPRIELVKGFWHESAYRKKSWKYDDRHDYI